MLDDLFLFDWKKYLAQLWVGWQKKVLASVQELRELKYLSEATTKSWKEMQSFSLEAKYLI